MEFFSSPSVIIDGIDFSIQIEIKQLEDYDGSNQSNIYFGPYLCAYQNPFIRYFIIIFIFFYFYRKLK